MGKECADITSKKSKPQRDINHTKCNGSNNRNQEKGCESGTPHFRVPSYGRWNFNSTQKYYENKSKIIQRCDNQQQLTKRRKLHGVQLVLHGVVIKESVIDVNLYNPEIEKEKGGGIHYLDP
jgi:hypothetical protein